MERQREDTAALCELKGWRVAYVYIDNDCSAPTARVGPSGTGCSQTAVSEHEVAMMRIRMKRAARQRAEQGIPKWKRAFGYLDDTYPPDPVTAPLVKQAYAAVLAGGSITDIARAWKAAGAYGLTGRPWTASTVSLFLRAPRNAGLRAHNDEIVGQGTWPPLVDEKTWRAAQSVLNAPGRAPGRKTVRRHLLTGVLGCGKCGHHLSGNHTNDKRITHSCKQCRGVSVRAEHVEPLVMGLVAGRLARPDAVDLLKTELHDEAEAEQLRGQKQTLRARLDEIADVRADGLLTGAQAKRATDRIAERLGAIERREQDTERLRVFDGIPLGTREVADAVSRLSPDRLRAVLDVLMPVTVMPVGKGGHVFNPERVQVNWR